MEEHNNYISYKEIISRIDINYGDIVVVGSDLLRFMCVCRDNKEQFNPNIFIDSIIAKIGDKETNLLISSGSDYHGWPNQRINIGSLKEVPNSDNLIWNHLSWQR